MSQGSPTSRGSRQPIERNTNFKVVVRVRPPLPRELNGDVPFQNIIAIDEREQEITVSENLSAVIDEHGNVNPGPYSTHRYIFDHVYDQSASQKRVYETTAKTVVESALQGYNATIFAYGQTGTGKTFTMEGFNREGNVEARGIIPRAIEQIFGHIRKHASPRMRFLVRASYLQIYNEAISDLLKPERSNLTIREDKKRGVYVDGLSEWVVRSPAEIYGLMERGGAVRATGETKMNEVSSRSHAVFIVIAEQSETVYVDDQGMEMSPEEFQKFMHGRGVHREHEMSRLEDHVKQSFKVGKLNLVDLAGSERVRLSGATGQRLEESKQINRSLSALGNVISALTDAKTRQHIPYRDSKLTRMLEDSLGGNCKTTMMAMISPALEAMLETISTLKFANRAKNIRNDAKVNEDLDQKSLLRKYERELKRLRAELEERSKNVVDKRRLLELDEQRRRAEADKMAAIRALEARSLEFMHEKEEKKRLEQRIAMLMGQMIRGDRTSTSPTHGGNNGGQGFGGIANGLGLSLGVGIMDGDNSNGTGGENTPQEIGEIHVIIKEQQEKLRQEYEGKLADLERERESIEEEKAQVDRYKQLLLKQRDIMIALTQRLVERDEQIMALQDELDAYDRHHKELEEKLDEKTALLIKFQRISMEVNASSPNKNEELHKALDSWSRMEEESQRLRRSVSSEQFRDLDVPSSGSGSSSGNSMGGGGGGMGSRSKVDALTEGNPRNRGSGSSSGGGSGRSGDTMMLSSSAMTTSQSSDEDENDGPNIIKASVFGGSKSSSSSGSPGGGSIGTSGGSVSSSSSRMDHRMDRTDVNNMLVRGSGGNGNTANSSSGSGGVKNTDVVMKAVLMEVDAGLKALERRDAVGVNANTPLSVVRATQDAVADIMRKVVMKVSHLGNQKDSGDRGTTPAAAGGGGVRSNGNDDDLILQLRRDNLLLEQRIRLLENNNNNGQHLPHNESASSNSVSSINTTNASSSSSPTSPILPESQWRARCDTLIREREAVQTIMEQKIKVLVQSVSNAVDVVVQEQHGGSSSSSTLMQHEGNNNNGSSLQSAQQVALAREALCKDISALHRLVNASIAALRNAANAQQK